MQLRHPYPDDLSDQEWNLIAPLLTFRTTRQSRKGFHPKREMLNAIFYLLRKGGGWHHLPHDLPPWKSVYTQFHRWKLSGLFGIIYDHLRKELRILLKRAGNSSAGIVDSQSVKTTKKWGSRKLMGGKGILLLIPKAFF